MNWYTGTVQQPSGHRPECLTLAEDCPGHARVLCRDRHHGLPVPKSLSPVCTTVAESVISLFRIVHHRSCNQDQKHARGAVSGFGDWPQALLASSAVLARHHEQRGCQLLASLEVVCTVGAGHQSCGCLFAQSKYGHQLTAALAGPGHHLDVPLVLCDAFTKAVQLVEQVANDRVRAPNHLGSLRPPMPLLAAQTLNVVDRGGTLFGEPVARAVHAQATSCTSSFFIGANCICGRYTVSQIACALAASFLPCLPLSRYGATTFAAMMRVWCKNCLDCRAPVVRAGARRHAGEARRQLGGNLELRLASLLAPTPRCSRHPLLAPQNRSLRDRSQSQ